MPSTKSSSASEVRGLGVWLSAAAVLGCTSLCAQAPWRELKKRHLPFSTAENTGVLADFDGDGDLDYFTCDENASVRLSANDGAGRFTPHPMLIPALPGTPSAPFRGDVDGDGDPDVVMNNVVLITGAATFTAFACAFGTVQACEDFTGDGRADVFSSTGLWHSLGNGTFTLAWPVAISDMQDAAAADLDADGDLDLVLARQLGGSVFRNDGGTFTFAANFTVGNHTPVAVAGDLDGDGDVDCAIGGSPWHLLRNDGTGALRPWVTYSGYSSGWLGDFIADIDGDGDLDLTSRTGWLRNDGNGVFQPLELRPESSHLDAVGDVDSDGRQDLLGYDHSIVHWLLLQRSPGQFVDSTLPSLPGRQVQAVVSDCDGDGDADYVSSDGRLLRNDSSGWCEEQPTGSPLFAPSLSADVDGDGDLDVVGQLGLGGPASVMVNDGTGNYVTVVVSQALGGPMAAFDADGDSDLDLLLGGMRLLRNDGTGTFTLDPLVPAGGSQCFVAGAADFDGDGDIDVLANDWQLHMFVNDGTGAFTWTPSRLGVLSGQQQPTSILPFDADRDGDLDAFVSQVGWSTSPPFPMFMLRNIGGGTLVDAPGLLPPNQSARGRAAAGDLDGDGDVDIVVSTGSGLRHWSNDGTGRMVDVGPVAMEGYQSVSVHLVDVDGDGDLDVHHLLRTFLNEHWHAEAPYLAQIGSDYPLEFGGSAMPSSLAIPFLGSRARALTPPFGTLGIALATAVPLPLVPVTAGVGTLSMRVPVATGLLGAEFAVQAVLIGGAGMHLTPVVHDRVY